jgi:hypothetical protein
MKESVQEIIFLVLFEACWLHMKSIFRIQEKNYILLYSRHVQMWLLWGHMASLIMVLPVKIWSRNLAHRLRRSKEALKFFGVRIFSGGFRMGFKETLWSLGSERQQRLTKLKFWILFSSIGQFVELKFQFSQEKSRNHKLSWFAY